MLHMIKKAAASVMPSVANATAIGNVEAQFDSSACHCGFNDEAAWVPQSSSGLSKGVDPDALDEVGIGITTGLRFLGQHEHSHMRAASRWPGAA